MIGSTISHYKILEKLGEGGMGVVYKAEDTRLNRFVALKFLPPHTTSSSEERSRFLQEAQAASALNHPNVCTIHDIKQEDGHDFIVMEFVDGETLRRRLTRGPLDTDEAIAFAIQIGDALQEAHGKGIVHRDIKADNIIVNTKDQIKVMDFGLAKLKGSMKLTKTSSTVGTLAYMAPEQIQGSEVDHRSDIFSFGVVLFEMLTGRLPFRGEHDAAMMYSILNEQPDQIQTHRPNLSPEFAHILNRALEKNPSDRYQSIEDVLIDLRRLKRDSSRVLRPSDHVQSQVLPYGTLSKKQISTWLKLGVATLGVVLVALAVIFLPGKDGQIPTKQEQTKKMVVVLPFENLGSPEQEYFADGIAEEITSRLSGLSGLGVIARSSAMQYKKTNKTLKQIGEELNVGYVLQGTIRWGALPEGGSRVRINPALVKVEDATQVWSQPYEAVMSDVFKLQSDIATQVANALGVTLLQQERQTLEVRLTENSEAYDFYLRGKEYFNRSYERKDLQTAEQMFRRAIDLDPQFAAAYALYAQLNVSMYWFFYDHTEDRILLAKNHAEKALSLDPNLAEAHTAMGFYHYQGRLEYERALEEFETALRLQPNSANIMIGIASVRRRQGRAQEAAENYARATEIDPRDATAHFNLGETFMLQRRYADAERSLHRSTSLAPDWVYPYMALAMNQIQWTGNIAAARGILKDAIGHNIDTRDQGFVASMFLMDFLDRKFNDALKLLEAGPPIYAQNQFSYTTKDLLSAEVYRAMGKPDDVRAVSASAEIMIREELRRNGDDPRLHSALGLALAGLGRKEDAIQSGKRGVELMPLTKEAWRGGFREYELARIYAIVGEQEAAIEILERLLSMPFDLSAQQLRIDPVWDPLRDNARFQRLLATL
jgi:serine/threonine protein kinase/Tfp pilus assembly protein PilF